MKHFYFSLMFQLKGIEICKDYMKSCNPLNFLNLNPLPLQPLFKFQQLHAVHLFLLVGNYTFSFKPKPMLYLYLHFFFFFFFFFFSEYVQEFIFQNHVFKSPGCIPLLYFQKLSSLLNPRQP
jgi:hypothetical protein